MEGRKIVNLTEVWETVPLTGFANPIPICSVEYPTSNSPYLQPVLVRMRNVISTSFEIRLQEPIKSSEVFTSFEQEVNPRSVNCLIVEKGTWKLPDNRKILAESYTSTITDHLGSWTGEEQTTSISSLVDPIVVLGQIMTYNDTGFSAFWSKGDNVNTPPSTGVFFAGKHVGKDPQISRNNEDIGYVVIERGHGSAYGIEFEAGVTAPSTIGWVEDTDGYPHQYDVPFSSPPEVAVVSMATMYGNQGAWAALAGSPSDNTAHIAVTVDEDLLGLDIGARGHISESIATECEGGGRGGTLSQFYTNGEFSLVSFRTYPDRAACFPTQDGGWIYASNSEDDIGGVGAIKFDSKCFMKRSAKGKVQPQYRRLVSNIIIKVRRTCIATCYIKAHIETK
eukprot:scaffold212008_cov56-Attheya_sp.AAC.3